MVKVPLAEFVVVCPNPEVEVRKLAEGHLCSACVPDWRVSSSKVNSSPQVAIAVFTPPSTQRSMQVTLKKQGFGGYGGF